MNPHYKPAPENRGLYNSPNKGIKTYRTGLLKRLAPGGKDYIYSIPGYLKKGKKP